MFVAPKSPSAELWDGPRSGIEGAKEIFGADQAYENTGFTRHLQKIISSAKNIFMDSPGEQPTLLNEAGKKLIETGTLNSFFIPASWKKKRLAVSKQGVCVWRGGKGRAVFFFGLYE